jgi:hypothetical protein
MPSIERGNLSMSKKNDGVVLVSVKTPLMPSTAHAPLPEHLTAAQALAEFRQMTPRDPSALRVVRQLARETAGAHEVLAVGAGGHTTKIDPNKTTLKDIAVDKEVHSEHGTERIRAAALEAQGYAAVGV